jgi:hypothetical protein
VETAATTHAHTGRSAAQWAALVFGIVFILVALLGFLNGGMTMESDPARAPRLIGMFPVNLLHNLVHLAFGIWGIAAARTHGAARSYCIGAGVIYAVLAVAGWLSPNGFGLVPLGDNDIGLHAVLALALLAVGLTSKRDHAHTHTHTTTRA